MHPHLIAEHFTLRPLRRADAPELTEACQDPEVLRWCASIPLNYTEQDALGFIEYTQDAGKRGAEYVWAIDYSGVLAGVVTLRCATPDTAELGFWATPTLRGRGIITEACHLVLGFVFDPAGLSLESVEWTAIYGNDTSYRVAQKLGFSDIEFIENGTPDRPDVAGVPRRADAWHASMTREQWLDANFRV
ncbi:GNAT family N-acetyltransferase [Rothia sp. ZJ1223]|uniref:GNAT family N-acetyltransferase n=1 Tax=Rothia sp. ZJ1223 TaxID=2811098 RepID=UPI00195AD8D0|nr:GNAT family N-acetyltransferase [Rothia sp. ZJ1223]MBM7052145.1 GNAT family N-acetyltransferase [Rothia sp. ZJ1223]